MCVVAHDDEARVCWLLMRKCVCMWWLLVWRRVCVCALDEEVRMCVLAPDEEVCACIGSDEEGRARVCWLLMRRCMCMCWPPAQELNASAPCVPA